MRRAATPLRRACRLRGAPNSSPARWCAAPSRAFGSGLFSFLPTAQRYATREPIAAPPPLPEPRHVRVNDACVIQYIDMPPSASEHRETLVLLHGAPGTYQDFRHLVPHFRKHLPRARIVGINFPGFGGSTVDSSRQFELLNAQHATRLALKALGELLHGDSHVYLVGHSFGGHAAINLAAFNTEEQAIDVHGLILLAAAGMKPHRVLRPRENELLIRVLSASPAPVAKSLSCIIKFFYTKMLKFPSDFPESHYVAGIMRAGTTDFSIVRANVKMLSDAQVPTFSAWSSDDEFMEEAIPIELAEALHSSKRLAFANAGHNLQKTRAKQLAQEIASWIAQKRHENSQEVEEHP